MTKKAPEYDVYQLHTDIGVVYVPEIKFDEQRLILESRKFTRAVDCVEYIKHNYMLTHNLVDGVEAVITFLGDIIEKGKRLPADMLFDMEDVYTDLKRLRTTYQCTADRVFLVTIANYEREHDDGRWCITYAVKAHDHNGAIAAGKSVAASRGMINNLATMNVVGEISLSDEDIEKFNTSTEYVVVE